MMRKLLVIITQLLWISVAAQIPTYKWVSGSQEFRTKSKFQTTEPGARFGHFTFTDSNGDLWMFGGKGQDFFEFDGFYSDMWKYDKNSQTWNWVVGAQFVDRALPEIDNSIGTNGNNSLSFDGVDDYIIFNESPIQFESSDNLGYNQTFELWIKPNADGPIISWGFDFNDPLAVFSMDNINFLSFVEISNTGQEIAIVDGFTHTILHLADGLNLFDNEWHHLAVATNKSETAGGQGLMQLYLDGEKLLDEESSLSGYFEAADQFNYLLGISKDQDGENFSYYSGLMDELRFWNVARGEGEIITSRFDEALPNDGFNNSTGNNYEQAGLESYYNFNQGVANGISNKLTTLFEVSGNGTAYGLMNNFSRPVIFIGEMAEVRIWDSDKTDQEVAELARTTINGSELGLVAAYDFSGATPNGENNSIVSLEDLTANNRDGTFVNFALNGTESNFSSASLPVLPTSYPNVDGGGNAVVLADMNDDGFEDIISSFPDDQSISILLNDQSGGFSAPTSFDVGSIPQDLTTGFFNDDAFPDIAVSAWGANVSDERIRLFFGDGAGGFTTTTDITTLIGTEPDKILADDLNGDTFEDLIIGNELYLAIKLGDGNGNFNAAGEFVLGDPVYQISVDDFTNDGLLDIASTTYFFDESQGIRRTLSTLVNDGNGSFSIVESRQITASNYFETGDALQSIDLDNDGNQDLISYEGIFLTALGNGDGSFTLSDFDDNQFSPVGISTMAITDMNGDGIDDVVGVGTGDGGQLMIFHGNNEGVPTFVSSINIPVFPTDLKIGQLNNSGELDIVVSHASQATVVLRESIDFQRLAVVGTMNFDGDNDRIEMPDVRNWNADFTWEGWVKTPDDGILFSFSDTDDRAGEGNSFYSYIENGQIGIRIPFGSPYTSTNASALTDDQWHHIAITLSQPNNPQLYLDGTLLDGEFRDGQGNFLDFSGIYFNATNTFKISRLGYTNFPSFGGGSAISSTLTQPQQSNWTEGFIIPAEKLGRAYGASWTDANGKFNVFGGQGFSGFFNSIRQFDPSTREWSTIKGDDTPNSTGSFGTLGVSDQSNIPPSRRSTDGALDLNGNFWMFGGTASEGIGGGMNDLWKYDPALNEWVWMGGSQIANEISEYGVKGISSSENKPGARENHEMWADSEGNIWIFGGYGPDAENNLGYLNDLWKFNISSGEWTWISGDKLRDQGGVFGPLGEYGADFYPGGRQAVNQWVDSNGIVWILGGRGFDKFGISAQYLNDLWSFDPSTGEWAWQSGSDFANSTGSYNEKGLSSSEYVPGARWHSNGWADDEGNLWLYGGNFPNQVSTGNYSDFWKYEIATNEWTWFSGYNATVNADQLGLYGEFDSGLTPIPGARQGALRWTDQDGNFWMQGGSIATNTDFGFFNDLWKYDTEKEFWEYLGGSTELEFNEGNYGSKGIGNVSNIPRNRWHGTSWTGQDGKLWFFGGIHRNQAINDVGWLNDLWFYDPQEKVYTWVAGSTGLNASGIYGQKGQSSTAHIPSARSSSAYWSDNEGNFYLFGGYGGFQYNNDVWKLNSNTLEWTWISGNNFQNTPGSYGEKGVAASTNEIGARRYMNAMRDKEGMVWVFGGQGYDSEAQFGYLNDLWQYNPTTNEWKWISGPKVTDQPGVFGTKGVASADNIPPSRYGYESWIDDAGDIWIMGGVGVLKGEPNDFAAYLNDLWKYDTKTNLWTWVGGDEFAEVTPQFGTQGEFNESNVVDRRWRMQGFGTSDKSIWLFGGNKGTSFDQSGQVFNTFNDFWEIKFTPGFSRIEVPSAVEQNAFTFSFDEAWSRSFQIQVAASEDFSDVFYDETMEAKDVSIPSLLPGSNYYYRVNAINEIGESGFSDFEQVLTLPATPEFESLDLAVADLTPTSMNLDWNVTPGILDGYLIDLSQDPTFSDASMVHADFNAKSIAVAQRQEVLDLLPGTRYYARLQSINASGVSPYSATVPFLTKPATPTYAAESVVTQATQTSALVSWNEVPEVISGYSITVSSLDDEFVDNTAFLPNYDSRSIPKTATSLQITGLAAGTEYYAFLTAVNASGESEKSEKITLLTTPASPVFELDGSIVSVGQTGAVIAWVAPESLYEGYLLEVSTDFTFANTNLMLEGYGKGGNPKNLTQSISTDSIPNLASGQTYFARIRSFNSSGQSSNSNTISFTTVPTAPTFGDPSNISQVSASLSWSTPAGVQTFFLDVNTSENFDPATTVFEDFPTAVPFEVLSGLTPGTRYYVRVEAANQSGNSGDMDPSDFGVTTFLTRPVTPEFSNSALLTDVSQTSVTINWDQVPEVLDGYYLDIATNSNFVAGSYLTGWENLEVSKEVTSIAVDQLTPGTQYYARLRSYNATGASPASEVLSMITLPETPTFGSDPVSGISQAEATLSWISVPEIFNGYYMELSTDASFADANQLVDGYGADNIDKVIDKGQSIEFINNLTAGTSYYARLAAFNTAGASPWSDPVLVLTTPNTPALNVISSIRQTTAAVSWNEIAGADSYVIDLSQNFFQTLVPSYNALQVDNASLDVVGLLAGEEYQIRVRSKNASGESPNSAMIEFLTAPATPITRDATNSSTSVFTANWDPAKGATYYQLEVSLDNFVTFHFNETLTASTPIQMTGLQAGATYKYRVKSGNASGESPYSNEVTVIAQNNSQSLSIATPVFDDKFTQGLSATSVTVSLSGGLGNPTVSWRHRKILSSTWSEVIEVAGSGNSYSFDVTSAMLDDVGVEFEVFANDGVTFTENRGNKIKRAFSESESSEIPSLVLSKWQMISIPYVLDDDLVTSIFNELGAQQYKKGWRLMHYEESVYQDAITGFSRMELGKGYWFNATTPTRIKIGAGQANSEVPYKIDLKAGWNQIGNPFNSPVDWTSVQDDNNAFSLVEDLIIYNVESNDFEPSFTLTPFSGAFVWANEAVDGFEISPSSSSSGRVEVPSPQAMMQGDNWLLPLTLNVGVRSKEIAGVGMNKEASALKDPFDRLVPPRFEDHLEMYTTNEEYFYPYFATDVVSVQDEYVWNFKLSSNHVDGLASLDWDNSPFQGHIAGMWLVDERTGRVIKMTEQNSYSFNFTGLQEFSIHYSLDPNYQVLPGNLSLGDAFPNPAEGFTKIPVLLPKRDRPYNLELSVFDIQGRKVATITKGIFEGGVYYFDWNLADAPEITNGIYMYKLTIDDPTIQPRYKKILIKKQ